MSHEKKKTKTKFKIKNEVFREIWSLALLLLGVFVFRSMIAEPYVVPTGSLKPTVLPGDRIFVFKASYDLKFPFTDFSLYKVGEPKRGDIIVFRYPRDPSINYVKRLIGLPGDDVEVTDGWITVNGKPLSVEPATEGQISALENGEDGASYYFEKIGNTIHPLQRVEEKSRREHQHVIVPKDKYFFMGDNRDESNDSRYWGEVPKEYLKGKALLIWFSLEWDGWFPRIRWERIGKSLTQ
ncbi:MAG: signal peptidase I [Bdellovibrio sp.]|nr:signal peptidase I [Bdellovibrio sp.]